MSNRSRLLMLLSYMMEHTDENHTVSLSELLLYFDEQKEPVTRKTLREDISTLQAHQFQIECQRGRQNQYYMANRQFEQAEMKLLCDMVSSNQFLSLKQSKDLIQKITLTASNHQRQSLQKQIFHANRIKLDSRRNHLSTIETISNAIQQRKKVSFQYTDYSISKKKMIRHNGEEYFISPYALVWENGRYYLVGHHAARNIIAVFRMDRILQVQILEEAAVPRPKNFHVSEYTEQMFKMFSGNLTNVELECHESAMNSLIDHFGEDVKTLPIDEHRFKASVAVSISPTFFSWVFQFGGKVKVISPAVVAAQYKEMLQKALGENTDS